MNKQLTSLNVSPCHIVCVCFSSPVYHINLNQYIFYTYVIYMKSDVASRGGMHNETVNLGS